MTHTVYFGDNLDILKELPSESVDLIYIDPPFNTGKVQAGPRSKRCGMRTATGWGLAGGVIDESIGSRAYADLFDDFTWHLLSRAWRRRIGCLKAERQPVLPHRLP